MDVKDFCIAMANAMNIEFTLNDRDLSYDEVFLENGLLPGFARRADQLCSLCLGYGIGAIFSDDQAGTLGQSVRFDALTPMPIRLLCLLDVMDELVRHGTTPQGKTKLDELTYD